MAKSVGSYSCQRFFFLPKDHVTDTANYVTVALFPRYNFVL